MLHLLERVNQGEVMKADIDLLDNVANQIYGKCLCPLGDFAATPVMSAIKAFRADFDAHAKDGKKPAPAAKPTAAAKPAPKPKAAAPAPAGD